MHLATDTGIHNVAVSAFKYISRRKESISYEINQYSEL